MADMETPTTEAKLRGQVSGPSMGTNGLQAVGASIGGGQPLEDGGPDMSADGLQAVGASVGDGQQLEGGLYIERIDRLEETVQSLTETLGQFDRAVDAYINHQTNEAAAVDERLNEMAAELNRLRVRQGMIPIPRQALGNYIGEFANEDIYEKCLDDAAINNLLDELEERGWLFAPQPEMHRNALLVPALCIGLLKHVIPKLRAEWSAIPVRMRSDELVNTLNAIEEGIEIIEMDSDEDE